MLIWILSKLFSIDTLARAISKKPDVVACRVTTSEELESMAEMFQETMPNTVRSLHEMIDRDRQQLH